MQLNKYGTSVTKKKTLKAAIEYAKQYSFLSSGLFKKQVLIRLSLYINTEFIIKTIMKGMRALETAVIVSLINKISEGDVQTLVVIVVLDKASTL